jgi:glutamine---fructose-6-phosphate transaminase (isomerizing)
MYFIENEITSQFESLQKTVLHIRKMRQSIITMLSSAHNIVFLGSGSSYSIAKSAAVIMNLRTEKCVIAAAAGDILENFKSYEKFLRESVIITISRSGSTSELILAVNLMRNNFQNKIISICAKASSPIEALSDVSITIPWAFDESVCQTRTVSNLYAGAIMLTAFAASDDILEEEMIIAADPAGRFQEFQRTYDQLLKSIGSQSFSQAVVLGECEIAGIAEEGALAFKEICQIPSNHYPVLDVRHGPMVLINKETLVILTTGKKSSNITRLIRDIRNKGAMCLSLGMFDDNGLNSSWHIQLPEFDNMPASALFMLFSIQVIAFTKALQLGVNPDQPDGLDPWINLE